jgi:hypothetical protein
VISSTLRQKLANEIMGLAVDDYANLWEIVPLAQGCLPADQRGDAREQVRAVLEELAARGLVSFWWRAWPNGDPEPVPTDEAIRLLADDRAWAERSDWPRDLVVAATGSGERSYYTAPPGRS